MLEGNVMRKRYYRARVWLDESEYNQFARNVEKTRLSKEAYLRQLILGFMPKESPPLEYHELIRLLTLIGRNLNQIAAKLQSVYCYDSEMLAKCLEQLMHIIVALQCAVEKQEGSNIR